jgi:hypothetical protein
MRLDYIKKMVRQGIAVSFLLPFISAHADPQPPTVLVSDVEALYQSCPKEYPELTKQYDAAFAKWQLVNRALLEEVRTLPDYAKIHNAILGGFAKGDVDTVRKKDTCLKGVSAIVNPDWNAKLDLSLRYYRHEVRVPQSQKVSFIHGCAIGGARRGDNASAVDVFCSCSWNVISGSWTIKEYIDFQESPISTAPQFVRVKAKLDSCKLQESKR